MKKVSAISFKKSVHYLGIFLLGALVTTLFPHVVALAHGGDTNMIHGCVKNSNGSLRIVGENDTCAGNETVLDWPATAGPGGGGGSGSGPLGYEWVGNGFYQYADAGIVLDGYDFSGQYISMFSFFNGTMVGANFSSAKMHQVFFSKNDLSNANFSGVTSSLIGFNFTNLTNANFSNVDADGIGFANSDLTGANFTNASIDEAEFINIDLTGLDLSVATFGPQSIWEGSTCPDGTDSDANGETCFGHLSP